ncbi:uncharacterized protein LOC123013266 [Tribolium madens]|uniref:uncharacterized protein LOC123013266 n=1 Tax=Tribolium madens TaxID=41895 RepID=UPI001CF72583|nr:uncharacterized protein LOC123013266 [Tribolium madens]
MRYNGYEYVASATMRGGAVRYFKCKQHTNFCEAKLKLQNDGFTLIKPHNNHPPPLDEEEDNTVIFKRVLKARAIAESTRLHAIYAEEARRHVEAAIYYTWARAESMMRTARRRSVPAVPNNLIGLGNVLGQQLSEKYVCCEQNIFQTILGEENAASIVFACREFVNNLVRRGITEIHADGIIKEIKEKCPVLRLDCQFTPFETFFDLEK